MLTSQRTVESFLLSSLFSQAMTAIEHITALYPAVTLNEMDEYALLDRIDTKYLVRVDDLPELLSALTGSHAILETGSSRISEYRTLYFDTPTLNFYFDHHNGKRPRYKIRMREYQNTQDAFLEIKEKVHDLRTIKNRMSIASIRQSFTSEMHTFLEQFYPGDSSTLRPILWNNFKRITLLNSGCCERITIDLGLKFFNDSDTFQLPHLAVIELKQKDLSRDSIILQALKSKGYQPLSLSKYCTGVAFLNPEIKHNRFKQNFLQFRASTKRIHKNVNFSPVPASLSH